MTLLLNLILLQAGRSVGYEQNWSTKGVSSDIGDIVWYVVLVVLAVFIGIIWYKVKYDK